MRSEILSFDVLEQGLEKHFFRFQFLNHRLHFLDICELTGSPAPFACDELVVLAHLPYDDRLDETMFLDGCCKFREGVLWERGPWLVGIRANAINRSGL